MADRMFTVAYALFVLAVAFLVGVLFGANFWHGLLLGLVIGWLGARLPVWLGRRLR